MVHLFAKGGAENHFAEKAQTRFARYRRIKMGLYGLTAGLLAVGAAGAAFNLYQTATTSAVNDQRSLLVRSIQAEYQTISKEMAGQANASDTVRDASLFFKAQIRQQSPSPSALLKDVATVWSEFPEMRMLQAVWAPSQEAEFVPSYQPAADVSAQSIRSEIKLVPGAPTSTGNLATASPDGDPPLPGAKFEVLIIDASVTRFQGNYRDAITRIERMAERFNQASNMKTEIVKLPLDVKPTAILRANASATGAIEASEVRFTLKISRNRETT